MLLPLIHWLHRGGRHRRAVRVSHLGLWRGVAASLPATAERGPPDPAWRRRALLAALLFVALSGPQLPQRRPAITLWINDSLSMLTREPFGAQVDTRVAEGLKQARSLLVELAQADVEVRTLNDPWHTLGGLTEAAAAAAVAGAGRKQPTAPPAALLRRDRAHWLVTDGADATLFDWPDGKHPDRIIQVGQVTRNVGLERLAARRNLNDPDQVDLLLKLTNGGSTVETRELVVVTAAGEMARSTHRLDPGTSALVTAKVPASAQVRATLQPGDALAEDDTIALDLRPLRRRHVAVDSTCAAALRAAVAAHPALALAPENAADAEAALDCGAHRAPHHLATIRVLAETAPTQPRGLLQWSAAVPESRRFRLDPERLQLAARLQARPEDAVLLAVGGEPVIVSRAGASKLVETSLDFDAMSLMRGPEIPLLLNLMIERLLGSGLLDEIAITDRGPASSRVAPSGRVGMGAGAGSGGPAPITSRLPHDGTWPLLLLAVLALLWEIVALGRQWKLLRGYAGAESE